MKPLVIYHADCTDGFGAAFAAWLKLGDEAEYLPMQYGQDPKQLIHMGTLPDRDVYVLDFSLKREDMEGLFSLAKRVVWLDHHKTAFEMWCGKYEKGTWFLDEPNGHHISLDDNKSGALLAWEYFHPGTEVPKLIQHIDDRDRWQFKLDGSKELHAALASMKPWSFEQWNEIYSTESYPEHEAESFYALLNKGAAILRAQDAHIKSMLKQARKCAIDMSINPNTWEMGARTGLALNTPSHMSEVGHELAVLSGTYGLVWYLGNDNRAKCSLRSNGDYDVASIARAFGGGGHLNAAGFETNIETLMDWLR